MKVTQILFVLTAIVSVAIWILPFRCGLPGFFTSVALFATLCIVWQIRDLLMPWWDSNRFSRCIARACTRLIDSTFGSEHVAEEVSL
jgi:4-hydroxybenzoate polyprenyltransferase